MKAKKVKTRKRCDVMLDSVRIYAYTVNIRQEQAQTETQTMNDLRAYFGITPRTKRDMYTLINIIEHLANCGDIDTKAGLMANVLKAGFYKDWFSEAQIRTFNTLSPWRLVKLIDEAIIENIETDEQALAYWNKRLS